MSSNESEPDEEPTVEVVTGEDLMRHEISSMPLSKVRALKSKLGVKLFDKTFFPESADNKSGTSTQMNNDEQTKRNDYLRDNRKRPREISSKRPTAHNSLVVVKKKVRYDPRFECGEFDRVQFNRDYAFIDDMRRQELNQLKRAYREESEKDPDKAAQIKQSVRNIENQLRTADEVNAELEAKNEIRQENIRRMNEGKRPIYLNNRQLETKIMEKRFEKVKAKGNVKGYLKKRKEKALKKGIDMES